MRTRYSLPVSVSAIIYNEHRELLLLSPNGESRWQCVTGWLEQETIPQGTLREISEELGPLSVRLMDVVDAHTFRYRDSFDIVSIFSLVRYIDGEITPNDDVLGYSFRWCSESELPTLDIESPQQDELLQKALFLIKEYEEHPDLHFLKRT